MQAVINSTITPNMTFTQTSQKFGQWSDVRANTVYGLGFASESELGKFIEKFNEVKEATKNAMQKGNVNVFSDIIAEQLRWSGKFNFRFQLHTANTNGSSAVTPITSANASPVTSRSSITQNESFGSDIVDPPLSNSATGSVVRFEYDFACKYLMILILTLLQKSESPQHSVVNNNTIVDHTITSNSSTEGVSAGAGSAGGAGGDQQLKYENDRLKLALAQRWVQYWMANSRHCTQVHNFYCSSANAKKWEIELSTLKSNNLRLTSALQVSSE